MEKGIIYWFLCLENDEQLNKGGLKSYREFKELNIVYSCRFGHDHDVHILVRVFAHQCIVCSL